MNEERSAVIRQLRHDGLTLRAICEQLGISKSTVNRVLYPRVREYDTVYNRERYYVARCVQCGNPCTYNKYSSKARGRRCASCYHHRGTLLEGSTK